MFQKGKTLIFCFVLFNLILSPVVLANGKKLDLSSYKGKVVVVDFWASWCIPCRKSFPWLNNVQEKFKSEGLVILAINVDENTKDAKKFLKRYPSNFTIVFDPQGEYAEYYKIIGMPSSLIFDRAGNVVEQHVGFKEKNINEYENSIKNTLKK